MNALLPSPAQDRVLDPIEDPHGHAPAIVSTAPGPEYEFDNKAFEYGLPSRADHALGWVQVCLSCLEPGGTAVVAVPFATAVRASGRRIRAELLRAGVLTDVIALPERAMPTSTAPWQIWILTRPTGRPAYVLRMADLSQSSPDDLPTNAAAWSAVFGDTTRTREVPSIEVLDEDVLLVPAAHLPLATRDVTPAYRRLREQYADTLDRLVPEAPSFPGGPGRIDSPLISVAELVRSGALTFVDRDAAREGDVVVRGGFEAVVLDADPTGDVRAATVIRCDTQALDPHFLACFLRSEVNRRQAAGTSGGTFRLDVRRARVPRMPLSEQRHYGEAFRRLSAFAAAADQAADAARAATRTAVDGLTSGVFAPTAPGK